MGKKLDVIQFCKKCQRDTDHLTWVELTTTVKIWLECQVCKCKTEVK